MVREQCCVNASEVTPSGDGRSLCRGDESVSWLPARSCLDACRIPFKRARHALVCKEGRFAFYDRGTMVDCLGRLRAGQLQSASGMRSQFVDFCGPSATILFLGDSIMRGIFRDFFLDEHGTRVGDAPQVTFNHTARDPKRNKGNDVLCGVMGSHRLHYRFLTSLSDLSKVNNIHLSVGQRASFWYHAANIDDYFRIYPPPHVVVLGSMAWDLMMIHNITDYTIELERALVQLRRLAPAARLVFRLGTPLANASRKWQQSNNGRGPRFNSDAKIYNAIARKTVARYGGEILDAHAVVESHPNVIWGPGANSLHFYCKETCDCFDGRGEGEASIAIAQRLKNVLCNPR